MADDGADCVSHRVRELNDSHDPSQRPHPACVASGKRREGETKREGNDHHDQKLFSRECAKERHSPALPQEGNRWIVDVEEPRCGLIDNVQCEGEAERKPWTCEAARIVDTVFVHNAPALILSRLSSWNPRSLRAEGPAHLPRRAKLRRPFATEITAQGEKTNATSKNLVMVRSAAPRSSGPSDCLRCRGRRSSTSRDRACARSCVARLRILRSAI
jgi:hypothetical protein